MLVLSRKVGEVVKIGDDIEVRLLDIKSNQARIGINAPKNVTVHREEIYEQIKKESQK